MNLDLIARRLITLVVTILVPLALMLTSVRLLLNPYFLPVEYSTPGFPADPYGFTKEDRLKWGQISLDYLLNDQGISYLQDQRLPDGTPLYNERELSHMVDVKNLVQLALKVWEISLGLLIGLGVAAWGAKWAVDYRKGLKQGGWLTVAFLGAVLFGVLIGFSDLFTGFHRIFFKGDTWLFYYSDTLIRLFPMRLWRDAFLLFGLLSLAGGLILGIFVKPEAQPEAAPISPAPLPSGRGEKSRK